jgi:UDP-glucose 4-epimerase
MNDYENKTVAITGASGYLASVLIDALSAKQIRILRVSRSNLPPTSGSETLTADICSIDCWEKIVEKADIIFHLAGNTSVYNAAKDPDYSLNSTVLPITLLVKAAQTLGRQPRVIFASTATIYGLTDDFPVAESMAADLVTNYDLHKLFAEQQLEMASKQEILEGVSLRLANVYGPSSSASSAEDRGILNMITRLALKGCNLKLYGDGDYIRDYVYVDDVAQAFLATGVAKDVVGKTFNVASGKGITVREAFNLVVQRVENITRNRVSIENTPWPVDADPIEYRNFVADIDSLYKTVGWRPVISFSEGIDRMISFFTRENASFQAN